MSDADLYPCTVTKEEVVSAYLQTVQRTLNRLSDPDRNVRRRALEGLHVCLLKDDGAGSLPPLDVLEAAWDETILGLVLRLLSDTSEKCREYAVQLIINVAKSIPEKCILEADLQLKVQWEIRGQEPCAHQETIDGLLITLGMRRGLAGGPNLDAACTSPGREDREASNAHLIQGLCHLPNGHIPVLEDSEEVRLLLLALLMGALVTQCSLKTLQAVVDPLHRVLAVMLFDTFHEVRKSACNVLILMVGRDPNIFGNKSGIFLKALLPSINHSHSRVRIAVLQAIDGMVQCGLPATMVIQHLAPGVRPLAFDHSNSVRELFFPCVACWLNYKDRMKSMEDICACVDEGNIPRFYIPELLPLLLVGITDESPDLAAKSLSLLEGVGDIYLKFINELDARNVKDPRCDVKSMHEEDEKLMLQGSSEEDKKADGEELIKTEGDNVKKADRDREMLAVGPKWAEDAEKPDAVVDVTGMEVPGKMAGKREDGDGDVITKGGAGKEDHMEVDLFEDTMKGEVAEEETADADMETLTLQMANDDDQKANEIGEVVTVQGSREEDNNIFNGSMNVVSVEGTGEEGSKRADWDKEAVLFEIAGEDDEKNANAKRDMMILEGSKGEDKKATDNGYTGCTNLQLPAPYAGRPGVGCRLMVERGRATLRGEAKSYFNMVHQGIKAFLRPLITPTLKDLREWTVPTRLGAARLLHTMLVLAERHAVDHLDLLFPALCSAVGDDDVAVAQQVIAAVHVLGFHVSAKEWLPLVLDPLTSPCSSQPQRANVLVVVAGLLYGTPPHELQEQFIVQLSDGLYQADICCSHHPAVQCQLLAVLTNIVEVAGPLCGSSSFKLFVLLLQVQSMEGDTDLPERAGHVLKALAKVMGMDSARELYVQHIESLMEIVTFGYEGWSSGLPGKLLFQTFMRNASDTVGPYLKSLLPLFGACLQLDQDPALRISFLQLLDELFENCQLGHWWSPLAPKIIGDLLIPCGVWRASKTAAAIRHAAMVALGTFLGRDLCSQAHLEEVMHTPQGFLPVVKSCLEEDYFLDMRRVTCHVMYQFLRISGHILDDEQRSTLIMDLQKRLDDSSDNVRIGILPAIAAFFCTMPAAFSDASVQSFLTNLIVHMDDLNPQIQEGVCKAAEECAKKKPGLVVEVLATVCHHHRDTQFSDRVLAIANTGEGGY